MSLRYIIRYIFPAVFLLTSLGASTATAQGNRDATVGFYLSESRVRNCSIEPLSCNDEKILVTGDLYSPYYAILCVFNGDPSVGVAGVALGIDYDGAPSSGVELDSWTKCGTLEFPQEDWPGAGTGNLITWNPSTNCQTEVPGGGGTGVTAVIGYFEVSAYTGDRLQVIERPVSGYIGVADCEAKETQIPKEQGGWVGFSDDNTVKGHLPCVERQVLDTTWGTIKSTYDDN